MKRKIDIFRKIPQGVGYGANVAKFRLEYLCSTNWHATVKAAVASVSESKGIPDNELSGRFA